MGKVRGSGLVAVVLGAALAGCGGEEETASPFVGTWSYVAGMSTVSCPPLPAMNETTMGTLPINRGSDAPLEAAKNLGFGSQACTIKLSVAGAVASAMPNQMCTVTVMGFMPTVKIDSYTLTVAGDMMTETGAGTTMVMVPGFPTFNCQYNGTGSLKKAQ